MKIIFLDIDGVMNRFPPHEGDILSFPRGNGEFGFLDGPNEIIRDLVERGCKIVLSSSWRHYVDIEEVENNIDIPHGSVIGITPESSCGRGEEIIGWLLETDVDVENFVILDDSVEDIECQPTLGSHVVRTRTHEGLLPKHLKLISDILDLDK